jgi:hypothetical protein
MLWLINRGVKAADDIATATPVKVPVVMLLAFRFVSEEPSLLQPGVDPFDRNTAPLVPIPSLDRFVAPAAYKRSPPAKNVMPLPPNEGESTPEETTCYVQV